MTPPAPNSTHWISSAEAGNGLEPLAERFASRAEVRHGGTPRRRRGPRPHYERSARHSGGRALAAYLLRRASLSPSVVIGYDGRTNSEVFARDSASSGMAGAGVRTTLLPRHLPTPVLAFAVRISRRARASW